MTKQILTPDICVIGAGAGGLSVAAAAAAFGVPVVLVEQSQMGGEHLNYGCVPSKALLAAARRAASVKEFAKFGVTAEGTVDFAKVYQHMRGVIAALAPTDAAERFTGLGVRVIAGTAQFTDRATVSVGDDIEIKARRFVIATGSSPATPLMQGLDTVEYLTNETIFGLTELPKHLIVVGAGTVGLELAQAFRRLGAAVSVIEARVALGDEEPECADAVVASLEKDGVMIHTGASIKQVARSDAGVAVTFEAGGSTQTIDGSHLLVTAGRRPNVDALDLKAARIKVDANGVRINRKLKTSNRRVYAIGDVTGGPPLTHFASYQAGQVIRNALFRLPVKINRSIIPRVTFTDPEIAQVGLTEAVARKKFRALRIVRWSYHDNARAQAEHATHGQIKVITDKRGKILGTTIVGAQAGELITVWTLATAQGLNIRSMADLVVPYPTLSDVSQRAALSYFAPDVLSPMLRRIIAWLRKLG
jgi:pyruvate/2-oxoglutarate dehydrogenase complex dihydrolipoamide dehydrogenase (E3) component